MGMSRRWLGWLAAATALTPGLAGAQDKGSLIGKVYDAKSGEALTTAVVLLDGVDSKAVLSSQARFVLGNIEPGRRRFDVRRVGYRPLTIFIDFAPGQTVERTFELEFTGQQLSDIEVDAKVSKTLPRFLEFERRRAHGVGHFITRDEILSRGYMNMGDALRTVKGVKVFCDAIECRSRMARAAPGCGPAYYVDGNHVRSFAESTPINDVQGIEVYAGSADAPAEFTGSGAMCGVIVIWTKATP